MVFDIILGERYKCITNRISVYILYIFLCANILKLLTIYCLLIMYSLYLYGNNFI